MNSYLNLFLVCLLSSNVCLNSGFAVPLLHSYKRSFKFSALVSLLFSLVLLISGVLYYLIYTFVLVRFEMEFLRLMIIVCLAGIFNFIAYFLLKKINKEAFYIYEKSYTFMFMMVSVMAIILGEGVNLNLADYAIKMFFYGVGFSVVNFIVYGAFYKLNGTYAPNYLKGIPLMLILLAVLCMAFLALGKLL